MTRFFGVGTMWNNGLLPLVPNPMRNLIEHSNSDMCDNELLERTVFLWMYRHSRKLGLCWLSRPRTDKKMQIARCGRPIVHTNGINTPVTHATHLRHTWDTPATHLRLTCDSPATHLRLTATLLSLQLTLKPRRCSDNLETHLRHTKKNYEQNLFF